MFVLHGLLIQKKSKYFRYFMFKVFDLINEIEMEFL